MDLDFAVKIQSDHQILDRDQLSSPFPLSTIAANRAKDEIRAQQWEPSA
jgi:hypothetical protein